MSPIQLTSWDRGIREVKHSVPAIIQADDAEDNPDSIKMFCKSRSKLQAIHAVNRRNKPSLQEEQDNNETQNNNQKNKGERLERRKARKIRTFRS